MVVSLKTVVLPKDGELLREKREIVVDSLESLHDLAHALDLLKSTVLCNVVQGSLEDRINSFIVKIEYD